jgi:phosphohistidine swiveling domain-containing protein
VSCDEASDGVLGRLEEILRCDEWVKGAVNYDEDLHFSTFYLRASCAHQTRRLYPGYSAVAAFYSGFNETYYLLRRECLSTAEAIVRKALRQPEWLPRVVAAIYRRSDALGSAFAPATSAQQLRRLADARLLAMYRRHNARQRSLYHIARLPEALDRGVSYFTHYLTDHLRGAGVPGGEVGDVFAALSQPLVPSVLAQEILEFDALVQEALAQPAAAASLATHNGRARMFLAPELLDRLHAHREKWQFLPYHGYGRRELATQAQYLARLSEQVRQPRVRAASADLVRRFEQSRAARQQVLDRLHIDGPHRRLFEVYPEIGAAKLYRRHAQLRNFYYLDLLLAEIARRLGVAEWVVRCMVPEEVVASLGEGRPLPAAVEDRSPDCLFAAIDGAEAVHGGDAARELAARFQEKTRASAGGNVLMGVVASQGRVKAPCKVVIRADDVADDFPAGAIVVSESTDPDLLGCLRKAGGVLTEQGGVTSHAAIICRELGVPTIIGIEGLLDRVHDGDLLAVDAYEGTVTLPAAADSGAVAHSHAPDVIGTKAARLFQVRSLGFHVPDFEALEFDAVRQACGDETRLAELAAAALRRLGLGAHERLAVRSSAVGEDGDEGSLAGEFTSFLHVEASRLPDALREFVARNGSGNRGHAYRGGVIVQRMLAPHYAGVCLTRDSRTGRGDAVVLEMTAGDNEAVTAGTACPDRFVVDRLTGDLLEADRRCPGLAGAAIDVTGLAQQFLTLEARFGKPMDVEWAWADGKLYVLQARPVVRAT